jgi:WD40 repeat protein
LAFSGDGDRLASASEDGTVPLWATAGGQLLQTLRGPTAGLWGVACSSDLRLLAAGGVDGTVWLWAAESGQAAPRRPATPGWSIGSQTRLLESWRVAVVTDWSAVERAYPPGLLRTLHWHSSLFCAVALRAAGQVAVSGSADRTPCLWDLTDGSLLRTIRVDRRYERLDSTSLSGITEAQRRALLALGAIDDRRPAGLGASKSVTPAPAAAAAGSSAVSAPQP